MKTVVLFSYEVSEGSHKGTQKAAYEMEMPFCPPVGTALVLKQWSGLFSMMVNVTRVEWDHPYEVLRIQGVAAGTFTTDDSKRITEWINPRS